MILDFLLNLVYDLIYYFSNLLPDASISDGLSSAVSTAGGYLASVDSILPIYSLMVMVGIFLSIELFILSIKIINWFIRKIPTIS